MKVECRQMGLMQLLCLRSLIEEEEEGLALGKAEAAEVVERWLH